MTDKKNFTFIKTNTMIVYSISSRKQISRVKENSLASTHRPGQLVVGVQEAAPMTSCCRLHRFGMRQFPIHSGLQGSRRRQGDDECQSVGGGGSDKVQSMICDITFFWIALNLRVTSIACRMLKGKFVLLGVTFNENK